MVLKLGFTYLGVNITPIIDQIITANYYPLIDAVMELINSMAKLPISLIGLPFLSLFYMHIHLFCCCFFSPWCGLQCCELILYGFGFVLKWQSQTCCCSVDYTHHTLSLYVSVHSPSTSNCFLLCTLLSRTLWVMCKLVVNRDPTMHFLSTRDNGEGHEPTHSCCYFSILADVLPK